MADDERQETRGLLKELPFDHLKDAAADLLEAIVSRAVGSVTGKITDLTGKLTDVANDGGSGTTAALTGAKDLAEGKSPVKAALNAGAAGAKDKVQQALGGGGGGSSGGKVVNIIEEFDVGLPVRVAYDQWTTFEDFPSFTRKVEKVEQESDETITWRAQIFFSHRDWESTIVEQVPDERIVWKSTGSKGYADGAVTFHELAPTMTRVLLVIEYYPKGFFEKTANLWRAQGRRVRSDFKHIKRHMMTRTILEQDEIEGWRGEIRDEQVVRTHEEALDEDQDDYGEESEENEPASRRG
ncbi:SRPBCC family protein [Saccharopolyspora dendranthemae]|uniref:Putative membrane protein n=1 Tax=Saccharopolyspora dendranthemae TaxID=1181886 RepID=A0A561V898_9PSEU|nr:SRPBCC family protein [Saccharopolyspora dendranthemae]TWG07842.1 putative membrane protein [Saccharopolyspora dendranthemae]